MRSNSSDERIRSLERVFSRSQSVEDETRLMVALVRAGRVSEDHLRFLAGVGDEAAQLATGTQPTVSFLSGPSSGETIIGLVVFATLAAVPATRIEYQRHLLRRVLEAINDSLSSGDWHRDWHALASELPESSSARRSGGASKMRAAFEAQYGPTRGWSAREEIESSLLRFAKPYVMAGSPDTWDTGWTWERG
jgi:hypothetical protein